VRTAFDLTKQGQALLTEVHFSARQLIVRYMIYCAADLQKAK